MDRLTQLHIQMETAHAQYLAAYDAYIYAPTENKREAKAEMQVAYKRYRKAKAAFERAARRYTEKE